MKRCVLTTLLAVVLAFGLPLLLDIGPEARHGGDETAQVSQAVPEPTGTAAPEGEAGEVLDSDIRFTLLDGDGVREVSMAQVLPYYLAGEMPAAFEPEALKAQAVALRTYILRCRSEDKPAHPDADICTSPNCCAHMAARQELIDSWGDSFEANFDKICRAVSDTDGQYLVYEGEAILAVFHSSSEGRTEAGENIWSAQPYLVSVDSPETEGKVANLHSRVEVSADEFKRAVLSAAPEARLDGEPGSWLGERRLNSAGRVDALSVGGAEISGLTLRQLFSLRSTDFTLEYADGRFVFSVSGYGHGVGLSQYGANIMAGQGALYADILEHYYPGTELVISVLS